MGLRLRLDLGFLLAVAFSAAGWLGCSAAETNLRPSVLLIVVDTLRADAVSAYGTVERTTPHIDVLAHDGLLYTNAFAPSPWTLPSHASLFTGVAVESHGVGLHGRMGLPDELRTLAETLTEAGYATAGFAEKPPVSEAFGLTRGFEQFCALGVSEVLNELVYQTGASCDVVDEFERFASRETERPFFAFVNLYDPHAPYVNRDVNRFLPPGVPFLWTDRELQTTSYRLCDALPSTEDLATLRGLYYGDVAVADAKVGRLAAQARAASGRRPLIVIVTSDHGELFGERRLLGHEFTVSDAALRIPLVVSGIDATAGTRIAAPVTLVDLPASILRWTKVDGQVGGGTELPTRADEPSPTRDLVAWYSDELLRTPEVLGKGVAGNSEANDYKRKACGDGDRVFGDMLAITRWPYRLVWFDRYSPPELYDLSWDPHERSDQRVYQPELLEVLAQTARRWVETYARATNAPAITPSDAELDALHGLGYLEHEADEPD